MKVQEKTFYEQLQTCPNLDLRDNRGKFHNLPFILLGVTISLLSNRDGNLSSIHRCMENKNEALCFFLGIDLQPVVSRSHLPITLKKVNIGVFENLLFTNYGIRLTALEKAWFAGDGKVPIAIGIKGSIERGDKRGEVVVQIVRQADQQTLAQGYYNGTKESEIPCLRKVITNSCVANQKLTADALHLCPKTTDLIAKAGGTFLFGLKGNQPELLTDMQLCTTYLKPVNEAVTVEKGHGRLERRTYTHYDVSEEYFDARWANTGFKSLFVVERERLIFKTQIESHEISYYISNGVASKEENYFGAIRGHWGVEVNNHLRDVTLREDKLKTKQKVVSQVLAGMRTLVINFLKKLNPKSFIAQLEKFQDDFPLLLRTLRQYNFL